MSVQTFAVIIFMFLLFGAGLDFLKSKEILRGNKPAAFVVKITKASGKVAYGVKYLSDTYAGSYWVEDLDEFGTPEEAQKRADRINDKKTIKTERYNHD